MGVPFATDLDRDEWWPQLLCCSFHAFATERAKFKQGMKECSDVLSVCQFSETSVDSVGLNSTRSRGFQPESLGVSQSARPPESPVPMRGLIWVLRPTDGRFFVDVTR